jgi:hypothetical protein
MSLSIPGHTIRYALALWLAVAAVLIALSLASTVPTDAHRSGCHSHRTCPSDHATYRWRGLLCVSPASGESRRGYPRRVRYGGRTYYCKR